MVNIRHEVFLYVVSHGELPVEHHYDYSGLMLLCTLVRFISQDTSVRCASFTVVENSLPEKYLPMKNRNKPNQSDNHDSYAGERHAWNRNVSNYTSNSPASRNRHIQSNKQYTIFKFREREFITGLLNIVYEFVNSFYDQSDL
jgi:hypothetical protein